MPPPTHTSYKRDQVERAVAIGLQSWSGPDQAPSAPLAIDIKRLLGRDRAPGQKLLAKAPDTYAFHGGPPPGKGKDVAYSAYEAFALLVGLQLLRGGMPQDGCIAFMRRVRPSLEAAHAEILRKPPEEWRPELTESQRLQRLRDGLLVEDVEAMLFLATYGGTKAEVTPRYDAGVESSGNIRTRDGLDELLGAAGYFRQALLIVELVNAAQQLRHHLDRIPPRSRGRS